MATRRLRSKSTLVNVLRDTASRTAANEVYSTPIPVQPGEITSAELAWQAVDADALATQAVSSGKFAVGAWTPSGESIQRVPAPMTDYNYWMQVVDGSVQLHREGIHNGEDIINASSDSTGVTLAANSTQQARIYLTGRLRRPSSSTLYTDITAVPATLRTATVSAVGAGAGTYNRVTVSAAHSFVANDQVVLSNTSRSVTSSTFNITAGSSYVTVTVPAGHGVLATDEVTITSSSGSIASFLIASNTYPVVSVGATQILVDISVSQPGSSAITGTATLKVVAPFIDGAYTVRSVNTAGYDLDIDQTTTRGQLQANSAFTTTGTVTAPYVPYGSIHVVWWATDTLSTNWRYIYPVNQSLTALTSTKYEASSIVVTLNGGTGGVTNKATLTLTTTHDMQVGELVNVSGTASATSQTAGPLDGQFVITEIGTYTISWDTAETTPTTARSLVSGGSNNGRASLEVYEYAVYIETPTNYPSTLVSSAKVFEVVGADVNRSTATSTSDKTAQLSPNGLTIYAANTGKTVALGTDTDTTIRVQQLDPVSNKYVDTAAISSDGTMSGSVIKSSTDVNVNGINLAGSFPTAVRNQASYSGDLLNRLARGIVYHGKWDMPSTTTLTGFTSGASDYVIATGSFQLEDARAYQLTAVMAGLRANNTATGSVALYFQLVLSLTKPTSSSTWPTYYHQMFLVPVGTQETVSDFTAFYEASSAVTDVTDNYRLPAGVPIYWAVIVHTTAGSTSAPTLTSNGQPVGTAATAVVVVDVGPSLLNSSNTLSTTATYVGALETAGGAGTTTYTATKTITATETGYWDNYGRGTYGTSDPYANQYSIYQGNPGTASGTKKSAIEFPNLGLPSGATITGMRLYLKNTSTYDGSCKTWIGAYGNGTSASYELGSTLPTARTACAITYRVYSSGEAAWITLPSSWYSEWASGAADGILVGITNNSTNAYDSTISNYGYFQGVGTGMTYPPKLEVTYTYTA